jgi:hypothetical protein
MNEPQEVARELYIRVETATDPITGLEYPVLFGADEATEALIREIQEEEEMVHKYQHLLQKHQEEDK